MEQSGFGWTIGVIHGDKIHRGHPKSKKKVAQSHDWQGFQPVVEEILNASGTLSPRLGVRNVVSFC